MSIFDVIEETERNVNKAFSDVFNPTLYEQIIKLTNNNDIIWKKTPRYTGQGFYYHASCPVDYSTFKLYVYLENEGVLQWEYKYLTIYNWEMGSARLERLVKVIIRSIGQTVIESDDFYMINKQFSLDVYQTAPYKRNAQ